MRTSLGVVRSEYTLLLENCGSEGISVKSLFVSNVEDGPVLVDLRLVRGADSGVILKSSLIPPGETLVPFISKDACVNVEPGDFLEIKCDVDQGCHFVCSHSGVASCGSSSSSSSFAGKIRALRDCSSSSSGCAGGCCPEQGWFCCADGLHCAETEGDCPQSSSVSSSPFVVNGVTVDPATYFDTQMPPMEAYTGSLGGELLVQDWLGHNRAVYVDDAGQTQEEWVAPGQVLNFRSTIILGYQPSGSQDPSLPQPPEFTVAQVGNVETGAVTQVDIVPVAGASGYVFRFNGVAMKPDRAGPASGSPEGYPDLSEGQYQYFTDLTGQFMTAASANAQGIGQFSSPKLVGGGCCYPSDGNFYEATYESCMENNADGRNMWYDGECASSGSSSYAVMSNLSAFRTHSLDTELMDLFFNQGVNPTFVDLDGSSSSSSSSSSSFLLTIELYRNARNPYGDEFVLPEDVQLYVYAEAVDGADATGMVSALKVPGENKVEVSIEHDPRPDGVAEFSFQINIEHDDFAPARTTFVFRNEQAYSHSIPMYGRVMNMPGRITPEYITYLHGWISGYWAAYDAGDSSLIPELTRPASNANTEFYPFAHAVWQLSQPQQSLRSQTSVSAGGRELVEPWNFLGVSPEVFRCIQKAVYKVEIKTDANLVEWTPGGGATLRPTVQDNGFDCRSFTVAAIRFLQQQLAAQCPGASVEVQIVGIETSPHAIVRVELPGSPEPCCVGSFVYEPQSGDTFDDVDDYCRTHRCKAEPDLGHYPIDSIPNDEPGWRWNNPDWEKNPEEVERINDAICGCLSGSHTPGSMEDTLKGKCDDGTFDDWFVDNFGWDPGSPEPTLDGFPQILSCERVSCVNPDFPGAGGQKCIEDENGVEPYVCENECVMKWSCLLGVCTGIPSLGGTAGTYASQEECEIWCEEGAWCVIDPVTLLKTGACASGTKEDWKASNDENTASNFSGGSTCNDLTCPVEGECFQSWGAYYDCASGTWSRGQTSGAYVYCGSPPELGVGSWVRIPGISTCAYEYNLATGTPCGSESACDQYRVSNEDPSAPSLPSFTPEDCCSSSSSSSSSNNANCTACPSSYFYVPEANVCCPPGTTWGPWPPDDQSNPPACYDAGAVTGGVPPHCECPDACEWIWRSSSGIWEPTSGGIGVMQSSCQESGCDCPYPEWSGSFNLEVTLTACGSS